MDNLPPEVNKARTAVLTAWAEGTLPKGVSFTELVDRLIRECSLPESAMLIPTVFPDDITSLGDAADREEDARPV